MKKKKYTMIPCVFVAILYKMNNYNLEKKIKKYFWN